MNAKRWGCLESAELSLRCLLRTLCPSVVVVACSLLALSAEARSHEQPASLLPVSVGSRVRLQAPMVVLGRIEGTVIKLDGKSLLVAGSERTPVSVPRQAITQLEVSHGRHGHALLGMGMGAAIGAVLGAAVGSTGCVPAVGCGDSYSGGAAALGALGGGLWGAGIGALIRTERWSAVPLGQVGVSLGPPRRGGFRLSVSLAF
jgi:hypothetical protein